MKTEKRLLGYYNYTVVLTYLGMLTGFVGIVCAFRGETPDAVLCLMAAGLCDMFDGAIAATKERTENEKCFGIQIDSLSDLICFGLLPGAIAFSQNPQSGVALLISGLYLLAALIRLAYFNVDEQERQRNFGGAREIYHGLPVTTSALLVPILYGLGNLLGWKANPALTPLLVVMGTLFLLPIPLKKPRLWGKLLMLACGVFEVVLVAVTCVGSV